MATPGTAATKAANTTTGTYPSLPVKELVPSSIKQPRQIFAKKPLDQLTQSIRTQGVLEPLLVRPAQEKKHKGKHEIVCGERRWRAATAAGLTDVPVVIREMDDAQAYEAMIHENLHREDIHPLEEAAAYTRLMEMRNLSIKELARQVAQEETYVARRLSLNSLIESARKDFAAGYLEIGHALELARLEPHVQEAALKAVYTEGGREKANKTNAMSINKLRKWIGSNVMIDLGTMAPWSLTDDTLVPKQGACSTCQYRTGTNPGLFADAGVGDNFCTNPLGFETKMVAWLDRRAAEIKTKTGNDAVFISYEYSKDSYRDVKVKLPAGTLFRNEFTAVTGKGCASARSALVAEGKTRGQEVKVCIDPKCKDHAGRVNASSSRSSSGSGKSPTEMRRRRQELFDIRVAENTRRLIFKDALPKIPQTKIAPPWRKWLNLVALQWLLRIPTKTVAVIAEVFGNAEISGDVNRATRTQKVIEALGSIELERLLALMSFAHFGENEYMTNTVNQQPVIDLAGRLKLNYKLRDAEARLALASRRAKPVHERYLTEVKAGKSPSKPSIHVDPPKAKAAPAKAKAKAAGAK